MHIYNPSIEGVSSSQKAVATGETANPALVQINNRVIVSGFMMWEVRPRRVPAGRQPTPMAVSKIVSDNENGTSSSVQ